MSDYTIEVGNERSHWLIVRNTAESVETVIDPATFHPRTRLRPWGFRKRASTAQLLEERGYTAICDTPENSVYVMINNERDETIVAMLLPPGVVIDARWQGALSFKPATLMTSAAARKLLEW